MIQFNEELHKYYDDRGTFLSVTQLISLYKDGFDRIAVATQFLINHPNDPRSLDELLASWDFLCHKGINKGNKYHNKKEIENLYLSLGLKKGYVEDIDLHNLKSTIYPELRVYNSDLRLAGHIDKVTLNYPYFDVEDYKTYKRVIQKKGFRGKKMKFPINFLPDANYYHAALQLNLYAYLLEGYGYIPRNLTIHHKQFDDDEPIPEEEVIHTMTEEEQRVPKIYPIKYNKPLIENLLQHYVNTCKTTYRQTRIVF